MLSDLIPNISKHFLCSLLEHDYENGIEIINTITKLPPQEIGYFLSSLGSGIDGLFSKFELELSGYDSVKDEIIETLKHPTQEENLEELN